MGGRLPRGRQPPMAPLRKLRFVRARARWPAADAQVVRQSLPPLVLGMVYRKLPGQLDPPLDLFGGEAATPEWSRNQRLLLIEGEFLQNPMVRVSQLRNPAAIRHIAAGVIQRHLMMDTSRLFIRQKCRSQRGELNPYLASELDVHLNAFYLNLSGGLDNLAWAVAYEHTLLPHLDENDQDSRRFCLLTGRRFLSALRHGDQEAADVLAAQVRAARLSLAVASLPGV